MVGYVRDFRRCSFGDPHVSQLAYDCAGHKTDLNVRSVNTNNMLRAGTSQPLLRSDLLRCIRIYLKYVHFKSLFQEERRWVVVGLSMSGV